MKLKRYTEEQIAYALKQAENGTGIAELCRMMLGHCGTANVDAAACRTVLSTSGSIVSRTTR